MNRIIRTLNLILTICLILATGSACQLSRMSDASAIETAIRWCRLAPLPEERSNEKITVSDEALTIEITFRVDPAAARAWMEASPGLQDADGEFSESRYTYFVVPDQAAACTVQVDPATGEVLIQTYQS